MVLGFFSRGVDPLSGLPHHGAFATYGNNRALLYATKEELAAMRGKRALVTGSNVGVGYETALALAKAGAHVVLACRNAEKADAAVNAIRKEVDDKVEVEAWSLDLLSLDSVRALAKKWNATERALDLLVLNAGAITLDRSISKDGFEHSYQINCLSHFLLTILLLPSVARSMAPRIVNVTSAACHDGTYDLDNVNLEKTPEHWGRLWRYWYGGQGYGNSKLYQVLALVAMQDRLNRSKDDRLQRVVATSAHPGMVGTDIAGKDSYKLPAFIIAITSWGLRTLGRTPAQGAATSMYLATATEPGKESAKGSFWADCHRYTLQPSCYDEERKNAFWERICRDAGLPIDCI